VEKNSSQKSSVSGILCRIWCRFEVIAILCGIFVFLRGFKEVGGGEEEKRRGKKSGIWVSQKKKKKQT
jgi:hypothetical protein